MFEITVDYPGSECKKTAWKKSLNKNRMKNVMKKLLVLTCCMGFGLAVWAQDVITFFWKGNIEEKSFYFGARGGSFTIDWGDGSGVETFNDSYDQLRPHDYMDENNYKVTITAGAGCSFISLSIMRGDAFTLDVSKAPALERLTCHVNQLQSLDVSKNPKLTHLGCNENQLTVLDVSKNTALFHLDCASNQLTNLDVSKSRDLIGLNCYQNQLTTLDVSKNTALSSLHCGINPLESLDVSKNTALTTLNCRSNQLTILDISKNTALEYLTCSNNPFSALDVSKNIALVYLESSNNQLTSLDLSKNIALADLECNNNQLTTLDLSKNITLRNLECKENQLTSLDVSKNTALVELECEANQLTSLDVSNNAALSYLNCYRNQLEALDVSNNPLLGSLNCSVNHQLRILDVSKNPGLASLRCYNIQLASLDISNNALLSYLECYDNALSLSDLYAASQKIANVESKYLGMQTLAMERVALNMPVAADDVFNGEGTSFIVTKSGGDATEGVDYRISGGMITFLTDGVYRVEMSNPAITSNSYAPAKVIANFAAGNVSLSEPVSMFSLYPNPTTGLLRVESQGIGMGAVRVFDMAGKLLLTVEETNNNEAFIDMSSFANGVYFINAGGKTVKAIKR